MDFDKLKSCTVKELPNNHRLHSLMNYLDSHKIKQRNKFVYILWDYTEMPNMDNTRIKIGRSYNPKIRCRNIITQSGLCNYKPYIYLKCNPNINSEKIIHKLLNKYRGVGEWFNLSPFKAMDIIIESGLFQHCFELGIKPKELE
jgi:T5orf172 domain